MSPELNCGSCGLSAGRVTLLFPKASILENRPELCVVQNEASIAAGGQVPDHLAQGGVLAAHDRHINQAELVDRSYVAALQNLLVVASALSWQVLALLWSILALLKKLCHRPSIAAAAGWRKPG